MEQQSKPTSQTIDMATCYQLIIVITYRQPDHFTVQQTIFETIVLDEWQFLQPGEADVTVSRALLLYQLFLYFWLFCMLVYVFILTVNLFMYSRKVVIIF